MYPLKPLDYLPGQRANLQILDLRSELPREPHVVLGLVIDVDATVAVHNIAVGIDTKACG